MASPAERVIAAFKGVRATARALELDPSSVARWPLPKTRRGLGGKIPSAHMDKILRLSIKRGLGLTAEDLIRFDFESEVVGK